MLHRNLPLQSSFCLLASATRLQHISPSFCELFCHLVVFWAPQGVRATLWLPLQEEVLGIFLFSFQFPPLRNVMLRLIQFNRIRIKNLMSNLLNQLSINIPKTLSNISVWLLMETINSCG